MSNRFLFRIVLSAILCTQIFSEKAVFASEFLNKADVPYEEQTVSTDTDIDTDIGDIKDPDPITPNPITPDPAKPGTGNENSPKQPSMPAAITLSSRTVTIPKGKSKFLTASVIPSNTPLTWKTSDASTVKVENGKITGKKSGQAVIFVQAGNAKAECKVTVSEVFWNAKSAVLQAGTSTTALRLEKKYPKTDRVKAYKSSNPKIAKINAKGKITAGWKTGKTVITVTMASGATASCRITVQKKAVKTKKLTLSCKKLTLGQGEKAVLHATKKPVTAAGKVTWASSEPSVATVSQKGIVKARKKGKAKLTARTGNGKKAVCLLTVK